MQGNDVTLDNMSITYPNGFTAVHPTDLSIKAGEFFSILGPSGCGKTTILRAVSGFVEPSDGRVLIGGEDMAGKPPNNRPTALIFQNLALFPLMSVRENVAFGLEARGIPKRERLSKADELLDLVALGDQGTKKPEELSGGQKQRVAIARALAVEPSVLLLDEPLSALDLKLRQHMRSELRSIQQKTGVTFIYITHDQSEALTMSDRIAIMNNGQIEQVGTSDQVYSHPASAFAASFVGEVNRIKGVLRSTEAGFALIDTPYGPLRCRDTQSVSVGNECYLFVRPEHVKLSATSSTNRIAATVTRRDLEGAFISYHLNTEIGQTFVSQITNAGPIDTEIDSFGFAPECAFALPLGDVAKTGREQME